MFSCSGSLGSDTGFEFLPGVLSYEWYDTPKQHVGIQHLLLVAKHRHADYLLGTSAYQGRKKSRVTLRLCGSLDTAMLHNLYTARCARH
jgi:hypothetical protein